MREFYVFGSVCRGEPDTGSDIDILVITDEQQAKRELPASWSIYSPRRLQNLFARGTLFAWHLHQEAVPIWPRRNPTFLKRLGKPSPYLRGAAEIEDLIAVLGSAISRLNAGAPSAVYEFGLIALACRDSAMAAAPILTGKFDFSRHAPLHLPTSKFPLSRRSFDYLLNCRRATTRGGKFRRNHKIERHVQSLAPDLRNWALNLLFAVRK